MVDTVKIFKHLTIYKRLLATQPHLVVLYNKFVADPIDHPKGLATNFRSA